MTTSITENLAAVYLLTLESGLVYVERLDSPTDFGEVSFLNNGRTALLLWSLN